MDLVAILAFWSPADYRLPRQHLAATIDRLRAEDVPVAVAQVVTPGQRPAKIPPGVRSLVYTSRSCLFWKENLWNLAATTVSHPALAFVDTDVRLPAGWAEETARLLERHDVVQPYSTARWLDRTGGRLLDRPSTAVAIARGVEPRPDRFHPGFAWAMTSKTFRRLGGWYDRHPAGGGDFAWAYSLDPRWPSTAIRAHLPVDAQFFETPSFREYQERAHALALRVGHVDGVAEHLWHGEWADRQYMKRCDYMPPPGDDGEYPLVRRPDGLLEWQLHEHSTMARRYWLARREDGR